jgi:hypothetical protein
MFSVTQVTQIVLIIIRFLLKTDPPISGLSMENETIQPLEKIRDVESDVQKFFHLGRMDHLMVIILLLNSLHHISSDEKDSEEIDETESRKRDDIIRDNHYA